VFIRGNPPANFSPEKYHRATFSTCLPSSPLPRFPPRRGGSQSVFAAAHDRHGTASDLMHTVHKVHNENDRYARLTRSAAAVCDRNVATQENAPHMHNPLICPVPVPRQRDTIPLLSPLVTAAANSPFRDCSLQIAELSLTPPCYL